MEGNKPSEYIQLKNTLLSYFVICPTFLLPKTLCLLMLEQVVTWSSFFSISSLFFCLLNKGLNELPNNGLFWVYVQEPFLRQFLEVKRQ